MPRAEYLSALDRGGLADLIGLYTRLETRNIAEFGRGSAEHEHAARILEQYRRIEQALL